MYSGKIEETDVFRLVQSDMRLKFPHRRKGQTIVTRGEYFINEIPRVQKKEIYELLNSWTDMVRVLGYSSLSKWEPKCAKLFIEDAKSLGVVIAFNFVEEIERTPPHIIRERILKSKSCTKFRKHMSRSFEYNNREPTHMNAFDKWLKDNGDEKVLKVVASWKDKLWLKRGSLGTYFVNKLSDEEKRKLLTDTDLNWHDVVVNVYKEMRNYKGAIMSSSKSKNIKKDLTDYANSHDINIDHLEVKYKVTKQMLDTGIYPRPLSQTYILIDALINLGYRESKKCDECGCGTIWNEKTLTLELDHIDGNHFNNQVDNLRILCPNCHTQQATSKGKNTSYTRIDDINIEKFKERYTKLSSLWSNEKTPGNVSRTLATEFLTTINVTKTLIKKINSECSLKKLSELVELRLHGATAHNVV